MDRRCKTSSLIYTSCNRLLPQDKFFHEDNHLKPNNTRCMDCYRLEAMYKREFKNLSSLMPRYGISGLFDKAIKKDLRKLFTDVVQPVYRKDIKKGFTYARDQFIPYQIACHHIGLKYLSDLGLQTLSLLDISPQQKPKTSLYIGFYVFREILKALPGFQFGITHCIKERTKDYNGIKINAIYWACMREYILGEAAAEVEQSVIEAIGSPRLEIFEMPLFESYKVVEECINRIGARFEKVDHDGLAKRWPRQEVLALAMLHNQTRVD